MTERLLATRVFSKSDQCRFAAFSGDSNPMHMDAVFARRTQAGAPAVHGMHLLLWALDCLAAEASLDTPGAIKARFQSFVTVGDSAELRLLALDTKRCRLLISVRGTPSAHLTLDFAGTQGTADQERPERTTAPQSPPAHPLDCSFEDMSAGSGSLLFATDDSKAWELFPSAAKWIGPNRVAAIGATSCLVGMVRPGLHSIYASLALNLLPATGGKGALDYHVASADERFRLLRLDIEANGVAGRVECMARTPPVAQESMHSLALLVGSSEFRGATALVVGGSRGLGELTAKLIAAGGGNVIVTYHCGRQDADRVVSEITAAGGRASCLQYDARLAAQPQLEGLVDVPTHLYYFATPVIYRAQAEPYNTSRLRDFLDFYVDGFWNLIQHLRSRNAALRSFYPSTVFVEAPPRHMLEYAMAKSAGELLCKGINETLAPLTIHVFRLPRLPTDQTASNLPTETQPALDTLLPIIRIVQAGRQPACQDSIRQ